MRDLHVVEERGHSTGPAGRTAEDVEEVPCEDGGMIGSGWREYGRHGGRRQRLPEESIAAHATNRGAALGRPAGRAAGHVGAGRGGVDSPQRDGESVVGATTVDSGVAPKTDGSPGSAVGA